MYALMPGGGSEGAFLATLVTHRGDSGYAQIWLDLMVFRLRNLRVAQEASRKMLEAYITKHKHPPSCLFQQTH